MLLGRLLGRLWGWLWFRFGGDLAVHAGIKECSLELKILDGIAEVVELGLVSDDIGEDPEHGEDGDAAGDDEGEGHGVGEWDHVVVIGFLYKNLW